MSTSNADNNSFMSAAPCYDFADANIKHDAVLIVEGKKFHVLSGLLTAWSEYFEGLFGPEFNDANSKEIEIKEVLAEEFKEFLLFIYPTHVAVSENNLIPLITLAHRFLAPGVMVACKNFIGEYFEELNVFDLLEVAVKYDIKDLKGRIGSIIYASNSKKTTNDNFCTECSYAYWDQDFCHDTSISLDKISVNSFIHEHQERICNLSVEAQSFIIKASVGNYERNVFAHNQP